MFFIAITGIEDKEKHLGTYNNAICPSCGGLTRYEVHKSYRCLHVFFIPTVRWNVRHYVKTPCCGGLFELDPETGKEFEKNPGTEIRQENLRRVSNRLPYRYCPNCRVNVPEEFSYCPYCGGKL